MSMFKDLDFSDQLEKEDLKKDSEFRINEINEELKQSITFYP